MLIEYIQLVMVVFWPFPHVYISFLIFLSRNICHDDISRNNVHWINLQSESPLLRPLANGLLKWVGLRYGNPMFFFSCRLQWSLRRWFRLPTCINFYMTAIYLLVQIDMLSSLQINIKTSLDILSTFTCTTCHSWKQCTIYNGLTYSLKHLVIHIHIHCSVSVSVMWAIKMARPTDLRCKTMDDGYHKDMSSSCKLHYSTMYHILVLTHPT